LSREEIMELAEKVAYEMGSAAAVVKYAEELTARGFDPLWGQALVSRMTPDHVDLLRALRTVGDGMRRATAA
jgi:hypothetical protein